DSETSRSTLNGSSARKAARRFVQQGLFSLVAPSVPPEVLEAIRREAGVAHGRGNQPMAVVGVGANARTNTLAGSGRVAAAVIVAYTSREGEEMGGGEHSGKRRGTGSSRSPA